MWNKSHLNAVYARYAFFSRFRFLLPCISMYFSYPLIRFCQLLTPLLSFFLAHLPLLTEGRQCDYMTNWTWSLIQAASFSYLWHGIRWRTMALWVRRRGFRSINRGDLLHRIRTVLVDSIPLFSLSLSLLASTISCFCHSFHTRREFSPSMDDSNSCLLVPLHSLC